LCAFSPLASFVKKAYPQKHPGSLLYIPQAIGGAATYAEFFRTRLRDKMFVKDIHDIPDAEVCKKVIPCTGGHPGICKFKDAGIYKQCGAALPRLLDFVLKQPGIPLGEGLTLEGYGEDDVLKVAIKFLVAYVRKSDPVLVAFVKLSDLPGVGHLAQLDIVDNRLSIWLGSHVVKHIFEKGCIRARLVPFKIRNEFADCRTMRCADFGEAVDIVGGVVAVVAPRAARSVMEVFAVAMEAGFAAPRANPLPRRPRAVVIEEGFLPSKKAVKVKVSGPPSAALARDGPPEAPASPVQPHAADIDDLGGEIPDIRHRGERSDGGESDEDSVTPFNPNHTPNVHESDCLAGSLFAPRCWLGSNCMSDREATKIGQTINLLLIGFGGGVGVVWGFLRMVFLTG
jgi:hypothetical protein